MRQIMISISDSLYDRLINMDIDSDTCSFNESALVEAIQKGTPLPKGHGRLIDADAVLEEPIGNTYKDIDIAETIVEADKAESEEK